MTLKYRESDDGCTGRTLPTAQTRLVVQNDTNIRNTCKVYKMVWPITLTRSVNDELKLKQLNANARDEI